jgi:hypothetical protein
MRKPNSENVAGSVPTFIKEVDAVRGPKASLSVKRMKWAVEATNEQ